MNNMNKIYNALLGAGSILLLAGCSEWLDPKPVYEEPENINTPEYYEALRAYKASDHTICFGWFSGWNGSGTDMQNQLRGVPDSMDLVSHWNPVETYVEPLSPAQVEDLKAVQQKGTKVLFCLFWKNLGFRFTPPEITEGMDPGTQEYDKAMADYWGWYRHGSGRYDNSPEAEAAVRK
ncbi:endo-beta-N-acetylglucosaminidase F2, partial [gut metagenome]